MFRLQIMSSLAIILCAISFLMILGQFFAKLLFPQLAPKGFATLIILIVFFGSLNVLAVSVAGEYIAKIFEEVNSDLITFAVASFGMEKYDWQRKES